VILIQNGDIVHAIWDNIVGEDAVHEMIAVEDGVFNMAPMPPDFERTIYGDYQHILMEGVRKIDEKGRGGAGDDEPAPRPSVRPGRISSTGKDDWSFEPDNFVAQKVQLPTNARMRLDNLAPAPPPLPKDIPLPPPAPHFDAPPPPPPPESVEDVAARKKEREVSQLMDQGFSALRAGNRDEARMHWKKALELDPGNRRIELNLKKLDQDPNKRY